MILGHIKAGCKNCWFIGGLLNFGLFDVSCVRPHSEITDKWTRVAPSLHLIRGKLLALQVYEKCFLKNTFKP